MGGGAPLGRDGGVGGVRIAEASRVYVIVGHRMLSAQLPATELCAAGWNRDAERDVPVDNFGSCENQRVDHHGNSGTWAIFGRTPVYLRGTSPDLLFFSPATRDRLLPLLA